MSHINATIQAVAQSVMHRLVGDYSIDEMLTEKRDEVRLSAEKAGQAAARQIRLWDSNHRAADAAGDTAGASQTVVRCREHLAAEQRRNWSTSRRPNATS